MAKHLSVTLGRTVAFMQIATVDVALYHQLAKLLSLNQPANAANEAIYE